MTKHQLYLGLGSNLGDRERNLRETIRLLGERVGEVTRQSSFIETEPWGFQSDNRFLNAAVLCLTDKTPREVLQLTQQIERDMGRCKVTDVKSHSRQYVDRTVDIDILLYDDLTIDEPDLKVPHPLMYERDFVMLPLKQITNPY
ncbi:MAG: 2-amino-4-hydroxy-6-hydroxymethyldihydropteridine diphosphokinase [Prevotella sp.]|nr:2-amino-4-hydroxy-6-hydroxymethyldihydropteridine diphosphokinase [Prevotella sp.]